MAHTLAWTKQVSPLNTAGENRLPSIATDNNGNVYVTYYTNGTASSGVASGSNDIVIAKLNTSGDIIWIKQSPILNTASDDTWPAIQVDTNGNVYVAYVTTGTISGGVLTGSSDVVLSKLDTNGNIIWTKQSTSLNTAGDELRPDIIVDGSGNVYLAYYTDGTVSGGASSGQTDIVIVKVTTTGNIVWIHQSSLLNTPSADTSPKIGLDASGNVYCAYVTTGAVSSGSNSGSYDIAIIKLNNAGTVLWSKQPTSINTSSGEYSIATVVSASGDVYVSYLTEGGTVSGGTNMGGLYDIVVAKLDTSGTVVWVRQSAAMNTTGSDYISSIGLDSTGAAYISYITDGTISGGQNNNASSDITVIKIDSTGSIVWTKQETSFNTAGNDYYPRMAVDTNANVYVTYQTYGVVQGGSGTGYPDIVVFKLAAPTPPAPAPYCLVAGTHVLTPYGYSIVDELKSGDYIVTGDKRIVRIKSVHSTFYTHTNKHTAPYTLERDAFAKGCPPTALTVSGRHAIQIAEGLWEIPEEAVKNNKRVKQLTIGKPITYYHIALPDYAEDTLVANGQIVESLNDGQYKETYNWDGQRNGYVRSLKVVTNAKKLLM